ncbi:MAG TPA: hypothetical protein VMB50_20985, partial [Myxococcales bacterium]|nr:hypothetical protein [Myxococcales bacterium]
GAGCPAGVSCQSGSCTLPDGGAGACESDSDCPAGQSCSAFGTCAAASCAGALAGASCTLPDTATDGTGICCGSTCSDSLWDQSNCGGCGIACGAGQQCLYGDCAPAIACGSANPGEVCLVSSGVEGICCGSSCVDFNGDAQNCGGCGAACPVGASCFGGFCFSQDGGFAACTPPAVGCPAGTLCGDGLCEAASCGSGVDFCFLGVDSFAGACCGGSCVDLTIDPANCGSCGTTCASGVCVAPGYSNAPSLGLCLPPVSSGSCGSAGGCPQDGSENCVDDVCLENDCASLESYLCATPSGRAGACCLDETVGVFCADLANDPANCGGCGNTCPSGQSCVDGVCSGSVSPCLAGHVNDGCTLASGPFGICCPGGGCSDPSSDAQNCGGCGNACAAGQSCVAGVCG